MLALSINVIHLFVDIDNLFKDLVGTVYSASDFLPLIDYELD